MSGDGPMFGPITICPGPKYTRNPGTVWGTDPRGTAPGTPHKDQPGPVRPDADGNRPIWEWQWAQTAMYAHYFADFMRIHQINGFVLSEAEYAFLLTGVDLADELLKRMGVELRRDYKAGGRLRPDILGFHIGPRSGHYDVSVEILEVSTEGQATSTLREDLVYKLGKLTDIVRRAEPILRQTFSTSLPLAINVRASAWKPEPLWQRVVPLPLRTDPVSQTTFVEWICFQPTFRYNNGAGIDGLLLYEVHTVPLKSPLVPDIVTKLAEQERRRREQAQVAYGLTLTPWMTRGYLDQHALDRDQMQALAVVSGVGLLAVIGILAAPAIAGVEIGALLASAGLGAGTSAAPATLSTAELLGAGRGLQAIMQTSIQWLTAVGPQLVAP